MTSRRRHAQRGLSLIEVLITLVVMSGLMIIVYSMVEQTLHMTLFNESHNDLTIMTERAVNALQTEVMQAKVAYQEDSVGQGYRGALQLPAAQPVLTDSLMPVIDSNTSTLAPDDGTGSDRTTGNSLLIARQLPPLSVTYDDDNDPKTPDVEFLVDRYRFEYFYLSPNASRSFGGAGYILDLLESTSNDYADYFQLSTLTSAQLQQVAAKVMASGVAQAWDTTQPVAAAFYDLTPAKGGAFGAALSQPKIAIKSTVSLFPELKGGRINGKMDYSVAFIRPKAAAYPLRFPVFTYAQADTTLPNFPSGFEVKVVGPAKARKVMTRVLLMANYRAGSYEAEQGFVISSGRF